MKRWCLFLALLCAGCRETILHDLDELQANRVLVALAEVQIDAEKVREGTTWSIAVTRDQSMKALSHLERSRTVKPSELRSAQQGNSMMLNREERLQILERQLATNIEQTLERLPAVLEARVHLYLEHQDPLQVTTSIKKESASVLLITASASQINRDQVAQLVAGASGIPAASVAVFTEAPSSQSTTQAPPPVETRPSLPLTTPSTTPRLITLAEQHLEQGMNPWYWLIVLCVSPLLYLVVQVARRRSAPATEAPSPLLNTLKPPPPLQRTTEQTASSEVF